MAQDEDFSMLFEIVCCFHPTDYDPIGIDGIYVKSVRQIRPPEQRNGADAPKHSGTFTDGEKSRCANCGNSITYHAYNNYGWRHEEGLEPPMTPSMEICGKPVPS